TAGSTKTPTLGSTANPRIFGFSTSLDTSAANASSTVPGCRPVARAAASMTNPSIDALLRTPGALIPTPSYRPRYIAGSLMYWTTAAKCGTSGGPDGQDRSTLVICTIEGGSISLSSEPEIMTTGSRSR